MATYSSIPAQEILWTEKSGRLQSGVIKRVGHDLMTKQLHHPISLLAWKYPRSSNSYMGSKHTLPHAHCVVVTISSLLSGLITPTSTTALLFAHMSNCLKSPKYILQLQLLVLISLFDVTQQKCVSTPPRLWKLKTL